MAAPPDRTRGPGRSRHRAFCVCTPGLEPVLAAELASLGIDGRVERGGVGVRVTTRELYALNLWLRTASRVLVRVAHFPARDFAQLEAAAADLPWGDWLAPATPVDVRVSSKRSRLYHTGAVAERLVRAAGDVAAPDGGGQRIVVRVVRDKVTISLDASGEPLHKRGWRADGGKAPLRETLAAAMVLALPWDGDLPLLDPFCGSGTIAIEAAAIARQVAPGRQRRFAFEHWPTFEPGTWSSVREEARRAERTDAPPVVGTDRDAGAVQSAVANAEAAGMADAVTFDRRSISDLEAAGPEGALVANPPYGRRTGGSDLRDLYARLGDVVRARVPGWAVGLLVADPPVARQARLRMTERFATSNGGIPVRYLVTARHAKMVDGEDP